VTPEATRLAYHKAAQQALRHFPLRVAALELVSISENITFRITEADSGAIYALRLHRPGYNSLQELISERRWTAALAASGIRVQQGVTALDGKLFCSIDLPELQEQRLAGITHWLPGAPLSESLEACNYQGERVVQAFTDIGRLAAHLHNQSSGWALPANFQRPYLDAEGLLGNNPRWGRFWEHPDLDNKTRALLQTARQYLGTVLENYGARPDNFGLIHADLHPENLLLSGDALSIIDFDDAAFGWHLYDLGTALIEVWGARAYRDLRSSLLCGYRELRPLSADDENMLETFVLLRGLALIGWFGQRPEHGESGFFQDICRQVVAACESLPTTLPVSG
jgi:Ser/Thr protein kinase RdoA (MazF antagonist)